MQKQSVLLLICSGFRKITRRIRILAATTAMWLLLLLLQLLPSPDLPCRRARTFLSTIMVVSVRVRAIALSTTTSCLQNIMSQDVCLHISIITQAFSSERLSYIQMFFIFYIKQRLRYFQDPTMILFEHVMYLPNAVQPTLRYAMFSRSFPKRLVHIYITHILLGTISMTQKEC